MQTITTLTATEDILIITTDLPCWQPVTFVVKFYKLLKEQWKRCPEECLEFI